MFIPTNSFKLFRESSLKFQEKRIKNKPKMSSKEDIRKMINDLILNDVHNLVHEEKYTHYNKIYYKFNYKGNTIFI